MGTVSVLAASTRVDAAELEREDRPEETAAELEATATVALATAVASAAVSAGRSSRSCAGPCQPQRPRGAHDWPVIRPNAALQ